MSISFYSSFICVFYSLCDVLEKYEKAKAALRSLLLSLYIIRNSSYVQYQVVFGTLGGTVGSYALSCLR